MKNFNLIFAFIFVFALYIAGCGNSNEKTETKDSETKTETTENTSNDQNAGAEVVTVSLPTIQCMTCKKNITKALDEVDGVEDVDVSVNDKNVMVRFDKSKTDLSKIESTITSAGYDANEKKALKEAYDKLDDCCKLPKDQKEGGMH